MGGEALSSGVHVVRTVVTVSIRVLEGSDMLTVSCWWLNVVECDGGDG